MTSLTEEDKNKVDERKEEHHGEAESPKTPKPSGEEQEGSSCPLTLSLQPRADLFALELHAIRVSYLLLGVLKSLPMILNCGRLPDPTLVLTSETASRLGSYEPPTFPAPASEGVTA